MVVKWPTHNVVWFISNRSLCPCSLCSATSKAKPVVFEKGNKPMFCFALFGNCMSCSMDRGNKKTAKLQILIILTNQIVSESHDQCKCCQIMSWKYVQLYLFSHESYHLHYSNDFCPNAFKRNHGNQLWLCFLSCLNFRINFSTLLDYLDL